MGSAYGIAISVGLAIAGACGLIVSAAFTWIALLYARKHGLLDQPGQRRSHTLPTPRGGGIGIVVAALLVGVPALLLLPRTWPLVVVVLVMLAIVAVAAIGWLDDHRPLPVWPRIAVHLGAGLLVAGALLVPATQSDSWMWWWLPVVAIAIAGSINAHNFMDGIDGILGLQALFVMLGYGLLALWLGQAGSAGLAFATAAACLGFLIFNAPPARIFMGDVGSGTLGLLIGVVAALLVRRDPALVWACLILPSAFLVDSGLTLARRALAGQRWYTPHRQHLYQWLVRVKWSHARTDVAYVIWNLAVVAPLAWLAARWPHLGATFCAAAYGVAGAAWLTGKQACLSTARRRHLHEAA
ncbi:MAG TPA: glycosyltransferase family 4 protein [Rhodanobacteraceae bacterium]|nr:glycosyltransferase family 4 protein [Rhodanobacteraceae bacterium]